MGNFVYKSNGFYLGFIYNGNLYSTNGIYLGWLDSNFVWDKTGRFRGNLTSNGGHQYILFNRFAMPPIPRTPRPVPDPVRPPNPPANIQPITLAVDLADAF